MCRLSGGDVSGGDVSGGDVSVCVSGGDLSGVMCVTAEPPTDILDTK